MGFRLPFHADFVCLNGRILVLNYIYISIYPYIYILAYKYRYIRAHETHHNGIPRMSSG